MVGQTTDRGVLIRIPLQADEQVYGLGLQLQSFEQRGLKKMLRVNADAVVDTGDSHAPVPFYVTTRGYGVLVDTARYATFYLGTKIKTPAAPAVGVANADPTAALPYARLGDKNSAVTVEVPRTRGVDVYVFEGPSLREAVQRYNLFSGGGVVPPRWGLGFWYRGETRYSQEDVLKLADELRERRIPCDVFGLEPGWQTTSYSCSYVWHSRFPDPRGMIDRLAAAHYHVNLWEHPFVHSSSPLREPLKKFSGDIQVWGGLVPDFLSPRAREIYADQHGRDHVALGVSGHKGDECDSSDFTGNWSFPEHSRFPSGADGEQMHMLFGLRYQDALQIPFERAQRRTFGLVRSSGALATPYPYVLYSDLYDHRQFVRGVPQSGFSGLLWTPEVRHAGSPEELVRRLQAVVFSPLAMVNSWYLKNPPWKQVNSPANNAGRFADDWEKVEARCREWIELRMRLVPLLHAAFVRYKREGVPPFRALVMDYPQDPETWEIDDQYLMGDSLLVAPIVVPSAVKGRATERVGAESKRTVYLPEGEWHDFWTGERLSGKRKIEVTVPLDRMPVYVKSGAILPLATPTPHTADPESRRLVARVYGDGSLGARIYEDDGGWKPALTAVDLRWNATSGQAELRAEGATSSSYSVVKTERLP